MPHRNTNQTILKSSYCEDDDDSFRSSSNNNNIGNNIYYEIGVDEAGRGPMLGRVYASAAVLPKSMEEFDHSLMKDSKKFHSEKKIKEVAEYIKEHAIAWSVQYSDEKVIDKINIRNATHKAMHAAITDVLKQLEAKNPSVSILLLIDGNDFTPFIQNNSNNSTNSALSKQLSHVCIEGGDNAYSSIAAASILSKVSRDEYIAELCEANPNLDQQYGILKNKGYGTKKHMDGIKEHGITSFHRKSFGICRSY